MGTDLILGFLAFLDAIAFEAAADVLSAANILPMGNVAQSEWRACSMSSTPSIGSLPSWDRCLFNFGEPDLRRQLARQVNAFQM